LFSTLQQPRTTESILGNFNYKTDKKLPWVPTGYKSWKFNGHNVNYIDVGAEEGKKKPPLLLIHGFGASIYHWRYNIPALARDYHVYAIDLLGFGLSDKPIVDYSAELWRDQALAFIEEVVSKENGEPCVVAGNSLGGFTALYAAASEAATKGKGLINGAILLNAAGRFKETSPVEPEDTRPQWIQSGAENFKKLVIRFSFIYTKQPARIKQVLTQVYPVDPANVDDELVESIQFPAQNPNAPEVFYRVIAKNGNGPPVFVDDLLKTLKVPLLLLWGAKDPWIRPQAADMMEKLYPAAQRVNVNAGHCPHDEAPEACNTAMINFMKSVNP